MNVAHIINESTGSITIITIDTGESYNISQDHCNYKEIFDCLLAGDYEKLKPLLDVSSAIIEASKGKVVVNNGHVYYNGKEVHNTLVDRILKFIKEDKPFESLVLFLNNLLKNPSEKTIEELYLFLETGAMPITDDGCFLAYKKVKDDFCSYHASPDGTHLLHAVGGLVTMPREDVDDDRDTTCSKGLHFCSQSYLSSYSGGQGRVLIVKVNPRDVCAIPSDHANAKGRACCYEVVCEYKSKDKETVEAFDSVHVKVDEVEKDIHKDEYGLKKDGQTKFYNVRGNGGKFTKKS